MKQMEMKKGLIKQMEEHEYNKKKEKEYNYNYNTYNNTINAEGNCSKGNCTCCNNKYPINLLNYRKQYEFLDNNNNNNNNTNTN
jgi:hypothetical protein